MKQYEIKASKNVVATFTMDYQVFSMKFSCSRKLVMWIIEQHPEYKDCPWDADFPNDTIVVQFYSVGNLVIDESHVENK